MSTMLSTSSGRALAHSWCPTTAYTRPRPPAASGSSCADDSTRDNIGSHANGWVSSRARLIDGVVDAELHAAGRPAGARGRWPTGTTRCRWSARRTGSARRRRRSACPTRRAARRPASWWSRPTDRRSWRCRTAWLEAWWSITSTSRPGSASSRSAPSRLTLGNVDGDHQIGVAAHARRGRPAGGHRAATASDSGRLGRRGEARPRRPCPRGRAPAPAPDPRRWCRRRDRRGRRR